jgi:hypothetical protein
MRSALTAERTSPPQSAIASSQDNSNWSDLMLVFGWLMKISVARVPQVTLTMQGICSYFVLMPKPIETFGDAAEYGMIFRVECACGRTEYFDAKDLARVWGKARAIIRHKFKCTTCKLPKVTATPIPIDMDRVPRGRIMRLRAGGPYGDPEWRHESFRR